MSTATTAQSVNGTAPQAAPQAPEDGEPVTRTSYTDKLHEVTDQSTTVDGHKVTFNDTTTTTEHAAGEFDDRVRNLIRDEDEKRQAIEDKRANHRNRNRLYTLIGAMVIGLIVVWGLQHLGPVGMKLAPYSFIITVLFDSTLTVYALIRKY